MLGLTEKESFRIDLAWLIDRHSFGFLHCYFPGLGLDIDYLGSVAMIERIQIDFVHLMNLYFHFHPVDFVHLMNLYYHPVDFGHYCHHYVTGVNIGCYLLGNLLHSVAAEGTQLSLDLLSIHCYLLSFLVFRHSALVVHIECLEVFLDLLLMIEMNPVAIVCLNTHCFPLHLVVFHY